MRLQYYLKRKIGKLNGLQKTDITVHSDTLQELLKVKTILAYVKRSYTRYITYV